jgi:hypothetical protein
MRLGVVVNKDQDGTKMESGSKALAVLRYTAIRAIEKEGSKGSVRGNPKRGSGDQNYLPLNARLKSDPLPGIDLQVLLMH